MLQPHSRKFYRRLAVVALFSGQPVRKPSAGSCRFREQVVQHPTTIPDACKEVLEKQRAGIAPLTSLAPVS